MQQSNVRVERPVEGVAVVVVDRPERRGALDQDGFVALADAFERLAAHDATSVVVLTGTGGAFCAGADISDAGGLPDEDAARRWMERTHRCPLALRALPQPTIAAVDGAAAGAGLGLALLCDVRLAGPGASFSAPFARMGLVPDFGVSATLPRITGEGFAADAILSGRRIDAEEALRTGIASRLVDDACATAVELAATIAALPGDAGAVTKRHMRDAAGHGVDAVLRHTEPEGQARLISHPDFAARAAAGFAAKGGARR